MPEIFRATDGDGDTLDVHSPYARGNEEEFPLNVGVTNGEYWGPNMQGRHPVYLSREDTEKLVEALAAVLGWCVVSDNSNAQEQEIAPDYALVAATYQVDDIVLAGEDPGVGPLGGGLEHVAGRAGVVTRLPDTDQDAMVEFLVNGKPTGPFFIHVSHLQNISAEFRADDTLSGGLL